MKETLLFIEMLLLFISIVGWKKARRGKEVIEVRENMITSSGSVSYFYAPVCYDLMIYNNNNN